MLIPCEKKRAINILLVIVHFCFLICQQKIETILRICKALNITPDDILTEENLSLTEEQSELFEQLNACTPKEKETALRLLSVYLQSLK